MKLFNNHFRISVLTILSIFGVQAIVTDASARLIFTTENDGVVSDSYHLDIDDSSADYIDLAFGSTLTNRLRYDIALGQFIFNKALSLDGNQIINFIVENQATDPTLCADSLKGRMYYNTTNNDLLFCNGTNWVSSSKIEDNSITGNMLAAEVAGEGLVKNANGNIDVNVDGTSLEIASDIVQIKDGGITNSKLATDSVNGTNIIDGSVNTADLTNASVTLEKMATNSVNSTTIVDGSITNTDMASNSIGSTNIIDGSITTTDLGTNSVTTTNIANGSVTNEKLATDAVNTTNILNGAVTLEKMATNSVNGTTIVDGSITSIDLANGSVTSEKIATGAITSDKLATKLAHSTLTPEFPFFSLFADPTSANGHVGTLESDYDSTTKRNFYQWSTRKESTQDYDLVVQWVVPENFIGFCAPTTGTGVLACNSEIELDYKTNTTTANDNKIDITLSDVNGTTVALNNSTNIISGSANTWVNNSAIKFTTENTGTWTPGEYITLKIRLHSKKTNGGVINPVYIGALKFNYLSK